MPPTYDEAKGLAETMDQKVNIAPSDTKIEMGKEKEKEQGFKGLSKEELMQFANDPFWVKLRWVLFGLFWIIWLAMLAASVVIIIYAPKCPSPEAKQWWQKGPVYKASVKDFPDADGNTEHNLKDVNENIDYLVKAGVGSLHLTSLLSPGDLELVKPEYGTMEDWKSLSQALQERGIRVIVDFAPGSTSKHHMWYEEAQSGKGEFASYYKGGGLQLDLDNAKVQEELVKVMRFWAANGVDGFLVEEAGGIPNGLLVKFRAALEQAEADSGVEKVLMVDALSEPFSKISGVGAGDPIHLLLDEDLLPDEVITAAGIKTNLDAFIKKQPCEEEGCAWPAFTLNTTSHGADKSDALTMLKMLLPGTVVSEAGEELGLSPAQYPPPDTEDPALQKHLAHYSLLTAKMRHQDAN
jgi:hypothetical protein